MPHHEEIAKAQRFEEALDRLLQVDASGMFAGIHRINELLQQNKIENPMPPSVLLDLGITIGAIHVLQASAPGKK